MHTSSQRARQSHDIEVRSSDKAFLALNRSSTSRFHLGHTTGTQLVQEYPQSQQHDSGTAFSAAASRFAHDFSRIPVYASLPEIVQGKQVVSGAGVMYGRKNDLINDNAVCKLTAVLTKERPWLEMVREGEMETKTTEIEDSAVAGAEAKVSMPPKLTKKSVKGPDTKPCGQFFWGIEWELDKETTKGGWVVQKVEGKFDVKDCKGNAYQVPKEKFDPSHFPFWEAWEIKKNSKVTKNAGKVDDFYVSDLKFSNSKGEYASTARAEFYDGIKLPKDFAVDKKSPAADLPMTNTDPKLTGGTGPIPHNLKVTWDCCSKGMTKTGTTEIITTE